MPEQAPDACLPHYLLDLLQKAAEYPDRNNDELGDLLCLTPVTVKTYWHRIYALLGVHHRGAAVLAALQRGLITLPAPP